MVIRLTEATLRPFFKAGTSSAFCIPSTAARSSRRCPLERITSTLPNCPSGRISTESTVVPSSLWSLEYRGYVGLEERVIIAGIVWPISPPPVSALAAKMEDAAIREAEQPSHESFPDPGTPGRAGRWVSTRASGNCSTESAVIFGRGSGIVSEGDMARSAGADFSL